MKNIKNSNNKKYGNTVERKDMPTEYKWCITDIFENKNAWETACQSLKNDFNKISKYKNNLNSPEAVLDCLNLLTELSEKAEKIYAFAKLQKDTDNLNQEYLEISGKAEVLITEFSNTVAFIEPELLSLKETDFKKILNYSKLKEFKHYLENILRLSTHVLSKKEEEILANSSLATSSSSNIFRALTSADISFEEALDSKGVKHPVSEGSYLLNMTSSDRNLRKNTFKNLMKSYGKYRNTLAATLSGNCRSSNFNATSHKFKSTFEQSLASDNIPPSLYDNLLKTVHENLEPLHNYISFKKEVLGYKEFCPYDLYLPLSTKGADSFSFTFEEACAVVLKALKPLGETYIKDLKKGLNSGWIDIYENKGKRSGAYSWGLYNVHPFVLLNYQPRYNSISTLAHEMGHALHSYYSGKNNNYINADYTIFCAEVASTTNEILLLEYMLKNATDEQKIYLINQYLEAVRTTVYRQIQFAEFEKIIHAEIALGKTLTADYLEKIWYELNVKYYGSDLTITPELKSEWSRIPHFYTPFYVYKYATGYSAATTFATAILNNEENAVEKYLKFLSSGATDYSLNILKTAGADLNTSLPIETTLKKFAEKLEQLKLLLNK